MCTLFNNLLSFLKGGRKIDNKKDQEAEEKGGKEKAKTNLSY
jgi:hypothetical protein